SYRYQLGSRSGGDKPMHKSNSVTRGLTHLFLTISTGALLYPVVYLVSGSFTTPSRLIETILLPVPDTLNLGIIVSAWNNGLWQAYVFTLGRCLFYIALSLFVGLIGGYIFSKLNFPGRHRLFLLFLSGLVMPAILLLLPMYIMVARLPLVGCNNLFGQCGQGLIDDLRSL